MPPALSALTGVSLAVLWIGIAACAVRKANRKAARSAFGVVPERNRNAAGVTNSCVWHAETRGGMLVTWNSVLSGRESGNPVSFQTELKRSGDFIYRIDVPVGSVVSNFVTGAQHAGVGLYCCGTPDERTVEIILGGSVDLDGNHYVCRHSANPPGRPTIQGWVRLTKPAQWRRARFAAVFALLAASAACGIALARKRTA